jgi:hypothetical protein
MNYYNLEKRNEYLGLGRIPVLITDAADHSDYFNVSSLQPILTSGKNMFLITGNSQLLEKGTEIKVELIDVYGTPIFHTVNQYLDPLDRRLVTIWIFDDTPAGQVFVNIVGTAKRRPNGKPVPSTWEGRPNVRWRRKVEVEPLRVNDTPILFNRIPRVFLSEFERGQVSMSYATGSGTFTQYSASDGGVHGASGLYYSRGGQNTGQLQFDIDSTPLTSEMLGGMITIKAPATVNAQYSSPAIAPTYYANITDVTSNQDAGVSPSYNYTAQITTYVRSIGPGLPPTIQTVTAAPASFFATEYTISYHQTAATYVTSSTLDSYANIILANIDPMCGDVASIKAYMRETGTNTWFLADEQTVESKELFVDTENIFNRKPLGKFLNIDTYNTYWETSISGSATQPTVTVNDTELIDSMQISGSEALLGVVSRSFAHIKFSAKTTKPVQVYAGDGYYVSLRLKSQGVVDQVAGQQSRPIIKLYMSGSGVQDDGTGHGKEVRTIEAPDPPTQPRSNTSPAFPTFPAIAYTPRIVNAPPAAQTQASTPAGAQNYAAARMASPPPQYPAAFPVAPMTPTGQPANPISTPAGAFAVPSQIGHYNPATAMATPQNVNVPPPTYSMDGKSMGFDFTADADGEIVPNFIISNGTWWIADVSIQARAESGFTPNHTFMETQLNLIYRNAHLDFKFEFYNPVGQKADYVHYVYDSEFAMQNGMDIASGTTEIIGTLILGSGIILQGTN